jgi:NDP-sugar pyrophosphorylase family protein
MNVQVILEEEAIGTAGALRHVTDTITDTFLVMNGDVLCTPDLNDMKAVHEETDGVATMALTTVRESADYGVIRMKGNQIVGFTEKPDDSFSHLINAGIYLLDPAFLDRIPDETAQPVVDIESLFEQLADEHELNGYVYEGEWREVG